MGRRAGTALYRAQGAQPARPRAEALARGGQGRLQRHEARQDRRRGPGQAPGAHLAKWKLRCRPVATSLAEAGERLSTFGRYPPEPGRSSRPTPAIERLHEEFKPRIKTQCLLPWAATAAMLFWAVLAAGPSTLRRVDGWPTRERSPTDLDLAA